MNTAFTLAVDHCNPRIIFEAGVDANLQLENNSFGSVLAMAAAVASATEGYYEIMKFIIKRGADPNLHLKHGYFESALAAAAAVGHLNNVKCLVEYGQADINMSLHYGYFGNALAAAAAFSKRTPLEEPGETDSLDGSQEEQIQDQLFENIEYLVKKGQESVNTPLLHGRYGSVLAAAASADSPECVCYLIREAGADVNMPLPHAVRGNALAASAYHGRLDNVEILIEEGALVNLDLGDGWFANALEAAKAEFSEELMHWEPQSNIEEWKEGVVEFLESLDQGEK